MSRSLLAQLWNVSPRGIAHRLFPGYFFKHRPLNLDIDGIVDRKEIKRLRTLPIYTATTTRFMGKDLELVDAVSFLGMCDEIYIRRNYEFKASRKNPLIIDCGANIGMSIIFFKLLYPESDVIAFEPDGNVFNALKNNIAAFDFKNVELHHKAVWSSETELQFLAEGSWSGRLLKPEDSGNIITVKTARLKDYLNRKVDFLKIDVEGAETEIMRDCAAELKAVENLFLEYHSHSKEKQTLQEILSILQNAGFRYHIKEAAPRKKPFLVRTTSGMDSQLDIFAYRL